MKERKKLILVVGPTASGKTGLAIELAKRFGGEVISADSRQVYRGLDIGTAKATEEEKRNVPHHLIDIVDVDTVYSVADFKRDAEHTIADIAKRGKQPIIAGGTFFYIDALLGTTALPDVPPNPDLRAELEQMPVDALFNALQRLDPKRAATIDSQNKRRLMRALEIVKSLGAVPAHEFAHEQIHEQYEPLFIGMKIEKEVLRARFRERAAAWLAAGFLKEIDGLLTRGVTRERLGEIGFEYTLGLALYDGDIDKQTFIERFEEKNWQYARRQYAWLKRMDSIQWIRWDAPSDGIRLAERFLKPVD